ncbi:MAG: hypothetical protein ACYDCK_12460 [Thermoplasmatota archaeon]
MAARLFVFAGCALIAIAGLAWGSGIFSGTPSPEDYFCLAFGFGIALGGVGAALSRPFLAAGGFALAAVGGGKWVFDAASRGSYASPWPLIGLATCVLLVTSLVAAAGTRFATRARAGFAAGFAMLALGGALDAWRESGTFGVWFVTPLALVFGVILFSVELERFAPRAPESKNSAAPLAAR